MLVSNRSYSFHSCKLDMGGGREVTLTSKSGLGEEIETSLFG